MTNLIGQSLGRYHILEQLGEGGMATVYKAYDTRLETDVAVKVIRTDNLAPSIVERALKRFEREAKALAKLTHANIVKVTDYGEHEGKPYLVMPYLPGGTLKARLQGKPMPWQDAVHWLLPIARALSYAHKQGMIHRDIKPSNILITEAGDPLLTDFGIAKIIDEEATVDLTGTSATVGTPEYMAPEQVTSKSVDARADIYALGVVFYEMVTGRKPFQADTPMAVLFKHASEPLPRTGQFVHDVPETVEKVLIKALAKKPENRYQSMDEFSGSLEQLVQRSTTAAVPLQPTHGTDKPRTTGAVLPPKPPTASPGGFSSKAWRQVFIGAGGVLGLIFVISIVAYISKYFPEGNAIPVGALTNTPSVLAAINPITLAPTTLPIAPTKLPITITPTEMSSTVTTASSYALQFDGIDNFVGIANVGKYDFDNGFSVEAWVKPLSLANSGTFKGVVSGTFSEPPFTGGGWVMYLNYPDYSIWGLSVCVPLCKAAESRSGGLQLNQWQHLAAIYDGDEIAIYRNGQKVASAPQSGNVTDVNFVLVGTWDSSFNGMIDEVRIWNIALTQTAIQADMNHVLMGNEPGLVGYWRFEEGSGQTILDSSNNHNNGRLGSSSSSDNRDPIWTTPGAPVQ